MERETITKHTVKKALWKFFPLKFYMKYSFATNDSLTLLICTESQILDYNAKYGKNPLRVSNIR